MGMHNHELDRKCSMVDDIAQFEKFKNEVLAEIREMWAVGKSEKEIANKFRPMIKGRQITIALTERDPGKALSAIKDFLDREEGRPVEKKEITHQYAELDDNEFDALLSSELAELDEMDMN